MSRKQRILTLFRAAGMLLVAGLMFRFPKDGLSIAAGLLSLTMLLSGVQTLLYYVSMARHMVGGRMQLYQGVILLDMGMFTLSLVDEPRLYIILYLLGIHAFAGLVDILRGLEARRNGGPNWRWKTAYGGINLAIGVLALGCAFFQGSVRMVTMLYAGGLVYAALLQITSLFRRTAIVYIP